MVNKATDRATAAQMVIMSSILSPMLREPRTLGEHTDQILEEAGYGDDENERPGARR